MESFNTQASTISEKNLPKQGFVDLIDQFSKSWPVSKLSKKVHIYGKFSGAKYLRTTSILELLGHCENRILDVIRGERLGEFIKLSICRGIARKLALKEALKVFVGVEPCKEYRNVCGSQSRFLHRWPISNR